ncbi:MAG: 16S rRNA (adenine(1518)-N(6)/adenine(1519)-N(6))-dimethyltransferase RsmA [Candidatus Omnitrophota bacterium]
MIKTYAPLKRFGQNFLIDKNITRKICDTVLLSSSDCVLEIGPGRGALTHFLQEGSKRLIAIEVDRGLCSLLKRDLGEASNTQVICSDILKFDLGSYLKKSKINNLKVVANLPYYITTPIIEYLFKHLRSINDIFITVQKEVAMRMVAHHKTKEYGAFTCFVNYFCKPTILFKIKKDSFWPVPKIDSCFVRLLPYRDPKKLYKLRSEELFFKVVRCGFSQRRKQLLNPLSNLVSKDFLRKLPLGGLLSSRAEDLTINDFVRLSNLILGTKICAKGASSEILRSRRRSRVDLQKKQ